MVSRVCARGATITRVDLYGWDIWVNAQPTGDGTYTVTDGRADISGNGQYNRHTCDAVTERTPAPEPRHQQGGTLQENNERRTREAAGKAIAAIRILQHHHINPGPVASVVAAARLQHPELTYRQLAAVSGLPKGTVGRAIWVIETTARHLQQAA